ncbi:MAG: Lrp/AsnC family transcriptional regulator [Thermoprotei archaeon]|nr:MAG: Lrp/AsnC family transcriptional regulator [Thermoprotei archaeon]
MSIAFILLNTEIGAEEEVLNELGEVEYVTEAYIVYGNYDIIAKVEAPDMTKLKEVITWKIRRIPKVKSTLTMIIVEGRIFKEKRK